MRVKSQWATDTYNLVPGIDRSRFWGWGLLVEMAASPQVQ